MSESIILSIDDIQNDHSLIELQEALELIILSTEANTFEEFERID